MRAVHRLYHQITSIGNLFQAWDEFKVGKRGKKDVQQFERDLENHIFELHQNLKEKTYQHSGYTAFNIYDPKFRHIHKATVKDRIVHHAVVSVIEPIFDKTFINDSYSCRVNKGMHRAVKRLFKFIRQVSKNYAGECFALKLDIKKFFASVDHQILLKLLKKKIQDRDTIWLLQTIIGSFYSEPDRNKGIPIGNLTSQIFANIYLDQLDKFVKQNLKIKHYIRYADDFVIVSKNREYLYSLIPKIDEFLKSKLKLLIHEDKIIIRKYSQGIDFLGYIVIPRYILPRTKTKRRIFKKLKEKKFSKNFNQSLQSYLGYLSHANSFRLRQMILCLAQRGSYS